MAQDGGTYSVPNFLGGLNVAYDSTDLAPNEAVNMLNLTLDLPNVLSARHGFSLLDTNRIAASNIKSMFIYRPYTNVNRLVVACSSWVYIFPTISVPLRPDTFRLGFKDDSLYTTRGSYAVTRPRAGSVTDRRGSWWYSKVGNGDLLMVGSDTQTVTLSNQDTLLYMGDTATADRNGSDYRIIKTFYGTPYFYQDGSSLVIADSGNFTLIYNDTFYQYISLVDTGLVDAIKTVGVVNVWGGVCHFISGADFCYTSSMPDTSIIDVGMALKTIHYFCGKRVTSLVQIDSVVFGTADTSLRYIYFTPPIYNTDNTCPVYQWDASANITNDVASCNFTVDYAVYDRSKLWLDQDYLSDFLANFRALSGKNDSDYFVPTIGCNYDTAFSYYTRNVNPVDPLAANWPYYIFSSIPLRSLRNTKSQATATTPDSILSPFYFLTVGYNNQLYYIGQTIAGAYQNRIWYADINMPYMIKPDYNITIAEQDKITTLFKLRDYLFIATANSIYRMSGSPQTVVAGDNYITKVSSFNGIQDYRHWAKSTDEKGYFLSNTGLYEFDGVRPNKISYKIDPLINQYRTEHKTLNYCNRRLYLSFPDTNLTIVLNEDVREFYPFGFSIATFANTGDTAFLFSNNNYPGYVFRYPNSGYADTLPGPASHADFPINYETGWQTFGYSGIKKLWQGIFPIQSDAQVDIKIAVDFDTAKYVFATTDSAGNYKYMPLLGNGYCWGDYFKISITGPTGSSFGNSGLKIRKYEIIWQSATEPQR